MTKKQTTRYSGRSIQIGIVDTALTIAGLTALVGGLLALYRDSAALAATGIAAGIALLFAATVSRFEFLKGFGIEAKVRRLDATIDKAEQALTGLKELTLLTSKTTVRLFSSVGRIGGAPTFDERHELIIGFEKILSETGATKDQIRQTWEPLLKICVFDLMLKPGEVFKEYSQPFRQKLQAQMHNTSPLTPSQEEENAAIIRRQHNLDNHYSNCLARLYKSPLNQAPQIIDELVNTAPELDEDAKQRFTQAIKPYRDEVAYLVNNLSFRNIQFWRDGIPCE
ncbi:hypothetical protein [Neopusillimonas maritima]|jgi:hypothetical protein|uniref:Uncharacterized protein n=1 Tax=Neopusillimonas maritima TaxID=2026239 RepID=A0ABX9MYR6_9BURK|nr:hypothetical protein [Neopusillimonas maritima]RII84039.1 hypothetical protein CJO09_02045 [Neopusillimonas maritima]